MTPRRYAIAAESDTPGDPSRRLMDAIDAARALIGEGAP